MEPRRHDGPGLGKFRNVKPKPIRFLANDLVTTEYMHTVQQFPLVVSPKVDELHLVEWAEDNRQYIEMLLLKHGAILFQGFIVGSVSQFERFARTTVPDLLNYMERAAPRTEVTENVFTSTEFPSDQIIPLHHEMSYSHNWPTKLWFYCTQPAEIGGRTPLANDRRVFKELDSSIKARFIEKKVMYVRNYGEGVDLSWQDAFQTSDPAIVEEYFRASRTSWEWRDASRLRTRQVRQAVATHPATGETVWFNHAHLFHPSSLPAPVREALLSQLSEENLPRNVFYGDGTPIEPSVLEEIREVYERAAVRFDWRLDDVLMIDNFLVSHGRESFVGPRRVLVAMADLYTSPECWNVP